MTDHRFVRELAEFVDQLLAARERRMAQGHVDEPLFERFVRAHGFETKMPPVREDERH
jgi:hypothetical protein